MVKHLYLLSFLDKFILTFATNLKSHITNLGRLKTICTIYIWIKEYLNHSR